MKTEDGRLEVVAGASRSGKTAWVRQATAKDKRVFAWDPDDQWSRLPGFRRVTTQAELFSLAKKPGPLKLGYVAGGDLKKEFDFWAGCVQCAGRYVEPLTAICEEIADVTSPSKAPGNYGILLRRGLKRGINIYVISQRWAEADKTAVGNASGFVMFRMSSGDDVRYMARKTMVDYSELAGLQTIFYEGTQHVKETFFVKADKLSGKIERGSLRF